MSGQNRPALTDEERALLTPEELAQYDDPDYSEDGDDAGPGEDNDVSAQAGEQDKAKPAEDIDAGAAGDAGDDPDGADAGKAAGDAGEGDDDAAKAAADAAAKAAEQARTQPARDEPDVSYPVWEKPEGADDRIKEIDVALDALHAKFDDAEITAAELREQSRELQREQQDLQWRVKRAEDSEEAARQIAERRAAAEKARQTDWYDTTVPGFFKDHPEYSDLESEAAFDFDAKVRFLQKKAVAEGRTQYDPAILTEAHEALTGRRTPKPAAKQTEQRGAREIAPNLAHVPAADATSAADHEFAHLNNLKGEALEAAISRMSDQQRDRYLQQG